MFLRKVGACFRKVTFRETRRTCSSSTFKELELVLGHYKDVKLTPLRLKGCSFGKPFTSTNVSYEEFYISGSDSSNEECVPQVKFQHIYQQAFEHLYRLLNGKLTASNYETADFISAALTLQHFLSEIESHEKSLRRKTETPEEDILNNNEDVVAVLLTSHLLSPLVPGHEYIISNDYNYKPKFCPCLSACVKEINYGQTRIGNEVMWYGIPDIILLPNSVMVEPEKKRKKKKKYKLTDECNSKLADICEEKKGKDGLLSQNVASQIISQTITFSLYTSSLKKRRPELATANVTLIPSILLTPYHYSMYMYDYDHDVLLTSSPQSLKVWDETGYHFNKSTVLQLWMLLNHMKCTPFLHPNQANCIKGSSNFQNLCTLSGLDLSDIEKHILFKSQFNPVKDHLKKRPKFDLDP